MLFDDSYTVPAQTGEAFLKEKGSKFFAFAYPVQSEDEIKEKLEELRAKYPDANHHCYAWVLNPDKSAQRANDDGEPNNTAGKPILRQIMSANLTNVLVVVVRYFGGTLLGVSGLISAYGGAGKMALAEAGADEKQINGIFDIDYEYAAEGDVFRFVKTLGGEITSVDKQAKGKVTFTIRKTKVEEVHNLWHDFRSFELSFKGYT